MPTPKHVPLTSEIAASMKVAETSVEAAHYFVERLTDILTKTKMLDKSGEILSKAKDFAKFVDFKLNSSAQPWSGQIPKSTDLENIQDHLAAEAIQSVRSFTQDPIKLDLAINNVAQLLRGYSVQGNPIKDPVIINALDKIFNAWLAKNHVVSSGSTLYQVNEKGALVHGSKGDTLADVEHIKKLMNDPNDGLAKFSQDKKLILSVDNSHIYPSAAKAEPKTPAVGSTEGEIRPDQPTSPSAAN